MDLDQRGARRPPGGVAVFLTCGAELVGVRGRKLCGECRTSGWPDWAGPPAESAEAEVMRSLQARKWMTSAGTSQSSMNSSVQPCIGWSAVLMECKS